MSDQTTHDKLNASVETIISGRDFAATGDPEVDVLARLALGLRGLPARGFKARLRAELIPGLEARGLSGLLARLRAASRLTEERDSPQQAEGAALPPERAASEVRSLTCSASQAQRPL